MRRTFITCACRHRAKAHRLRRRQLPQHLQLQQRLLVHRQQQQLPQRPLRLRQHLHLQLLLLPGRRRRRDLCRRREPVLRPLQGRRIFAHAKTSSLPRRSPWLVGALAKAPRRRRVTGDRSVATALCHRARCHQRLYPPSPGYGAAGTARRLQQKPKLQGLLPNISRIFLDNFVGLD